MSIKFEESQTKENLMRAFAGESQARNRYTFAFLLTLPDILIPLFLVKLPRYSSHYLANYQVCL